MSVGGHNRNDYICLLGSFLSHLLHLSSTGSTLLLFERRRTKAIIKIIVVRSLSLCQDTLSRGQISFFATLVHHRIKHLHSRVGFRCNSFSICCRFEPALPCSVISCPFLWFFGLQAVKLTKRSSRSLICEQPLMRIFTDTLEHVYLSGRLLCLEIDRNSKGTSSYRLIYFAQLEGSIRTALR